MNPDPEAIEKTQAWWARTESELRLHRGQSGKSLLKITGAVGSSPYLLRRALEKLERALKGWIEEQLAPEWAIKLHKQASKHLLVLHFVPPVGDEAWSESGPNV